MLVPHFSIGEQCIELISVSPAFLRLKVDIPPLQEMFGFQMSVSRSQILIHFQEAEVCRVICILKDIESDDSRLLYRFARILEDSGFICLDLIGFDVMMNLKNIHTYLLALGQSHRINEV